MLLKILDVIFNECLFKQIQKNVDRFFKMLKTQKREKFFLKTCVYVYCIYAVANDEARQLAERLVVLGQSALVSVISPLTVAEAMRTVSTK